MEKYFIKTIAKILDKRPIRLIEKIKKNHVELQYENDQAYISKKELIKLATEYMNSKHSTDGTKEKAKMLLVQLDNNYVQLDTLPKTVQKVRKDIKAKAKVENKLYKNNRTLLRIVPSTLSLMVQSLESLHFKFVALFVAIGVQMHHSTVWFYRSSPDLSASWSSAIGFAVMYDLFILVVTMEGRTQLAKMFSILTFTSNILYFEFWSNFNGTVQDWTRAISSIMISAIIAFILYAYTEIFVKYRKKQEAI